MSGAEERNPYLPDAPADGKHIFNGGYRCVRCGVYNRDQPENPPFYEPCKGQWAESGKMRYAAEERWAAERRVVTPEPVSSEGDLTGAGVSHAAADDRARVIAADGWDDVDILALISQATEAVAWSLLDQTSDLADREPSREALDAARATARRFIALSDTAAPAHDTTTSPEDQA